MPSQNLHRVNEEGIYSHIYNKGVENRIIFNDEKDYKVFLGYLEEYLTPPKDPKSIKTTFTVRGREFQGQPHQPKNYFNKIELVAYNLMPDHFHLVLHQLSQGSIENLMRSLFTRYSMYYNKKTKRRGALFEGPYKSVLIKNGPSLAHLTRYLHQHGGHSSYAEYLNPEEAPWIKPHVVLSLFDKGTSGYKEFVEKIEPAENTKTLLEGLTFEDKSHNLEGRDISSSGQNPLTEIDAKSAYKSKFVTQESPKINSFRRFPELIASVVGFVLLLTLGLRNISTASFQSLKPISIHQAPSVLSATKVNKTPPTVTPTAKPTEVPKVMVTVHIADGSPSVNIRQKPTSYSEKLGVASDGASFEYVSKEVGWYKVKLADGSTGFIFGTYIEKEQPVN